MVWPPWFRCAKLIASQTMKVTGRQLCNPLSGLAGCFRTLAGATTLALVILAAAVVAHATNADVYWDDGAGNNDWGTASNWNPDGLPATGYGTTGDKIHINLGGANRAIYSSATGTNVYQIIRISDSAASGELDVTGGSLASDGTTPTYISSGGQIGTLNQSGGTMSFGGYMQVGLNANSVGNIFLSGGTLISARNNTAPIGGLTGVSLFLGNGNNAQGNFVLSGGEFRTRTGVALGVNGGKGRFEIDGAGIANIGTENTADDGFWVQNSGSTLAAYVKDGALGTVFVDDLG